MSRSKAPALSSFLLQVAAGRWAPLTTLDAALKMRQRQQSSTLADYRRWLKSEEGMQCKCAWLKYDPARCGEELTELYELAQSRAQEAWDFHLEVAREHIAMDSPEYSPEQVEDAAKFQAEQNLIADGYLPPAWQSLARCAHCGVIPYWNENQNLIMRSCPWCATAFGELFLECQL